MGHFSDHHNTFVGTPSFVFFWACLPIFTKRIKYGCRSQWPRGLRRRSATARLLRSWLRIPSGARIFICCECRVLLGRGLCDELITRPEESYRLWCVVVCDLETLLMRRPWPTGGCRAKNKNKKIYMWKLAVFSYINSVPIMVFILQSRFLFRHYSDI